MGAADALSCALAPPPADAEALARGLFEGQMAILVRLAEIGMEIAESAARRAAHLAEAGAAGADTPDPALAYTRVARAVRLTLALQSRLAHDLSARALEAAKARGAEAGRRRDRIHARVERIIEAGRADEGEAERLSAGAWERLTEADDADLLDRPIAEVVALICTDLGLCPTGARRPSQARPLRTRTVCHPAWGRRPFGRTAAASGGDRPGSPPPPRGSARARHLVDRDGPVGTRYR